MDTIARPAAKFTARLASRVALAVACLAPAADAAPITLYDSVTGNASTGQTAFDPTLWVGNQFKTDAVSYSLDSVVIELKDVPLLGTVTVDIYDDNGDVPDAALASLTLSGTLQTGLNTFTASGLNLPALQSFWVVLNATQGDASWRYSAGATVDGPGASNLAWTSDAGTYGGQPFMMRVYATPASSVPEIDPAGLGSVAALVTGVLALVERRRKAA